MARTAWRGDGIRFAPVDMEHVRRLDGRLLLVFRELLATQSVTRTSERLGLSQSAVSHALARLRRLHGDPLFVRRPHGLRPTRRARELAPRIDALVELAGDLYGEPTAFDPQHSDRRFVLAAPEFLTATIGATLLGRWRSTAPGVSLVLRQLDEVTAVDGLVAGDLDLAIGRFSGRRPSSLAAEPLYRDEYCVVARRDHPTIAGAIDQAHYLAVGHVLAASASEAAPGESVPREIRVVSVVPGWLSALGIVATSDAVATCPRRLAEQQAPTLGLQVLPIPGPAPAVEVSLLRRAAKPVPAVEWLLDEVRAALGAHT